MTTTFPVTAVGILTGIVVAIQVDHTLTGGNFDLSALGQVQAGRYASTPLSDKAFVCVHGPTLASTEEGIPLGHYGREVVFSFTGWAPNIVDQTGNALFNALNLLDDVMTAIENSARDQTGVIFDITGIRTLRVEGEVVTSRSETTPQQARIEGEITATYSLLRGA